jgi:hypothetical protein
MPPSRPEVASESPQRREEKHGMLSRIASDRVKALQK